MQLVCWSRLKKFNTNLATSLIDCLKLLKVVCYVGPLSTLYIYL